MRSYRMQLRREQWVRKTARAISNLIEHRGLAAFRQRAKEITPTNNSVAVSVASAVAPLSIAERMAAASVLEGMTSDMHGSKEVADSAVAVATVPPPVSEL
jgi:hypothetical protein